jgi:hypothetical protein
VLQSTYDALQRELEQLRPFKVLAEEVAERLRSKCKACKIGLPREAQSYGYCHPNVTEEQHRELGFTMFPYKIGVAVRCYADDTDWLARYDALSQTSGGDRP